MDHDEPSEDEPWALKEKMSAEELRDEQILAAEEKRDPVNFKLVMKMATRTKSVGFGIEEEDFNILQVELFGVRDKAKTRKNEKENASSNLPESPEEKTKKIETKNIAYELEETIERAIFRWVCCQLLPCVVHPKKMSMLKGTPFDKLPDFFHWATPSDVAFAILIFDNYNFKWSELEQYKFDFGEEMPEKHKRFYKGRYGNGNGLSGQEGLRRYKEILCRILHFMKDGKNNPERRFWNDFWEDLRNKRSDLDLFGLRQAQKNQCNAMNQEEEVVEDEFETLMDEYLEIGMTATPKMPPLRRLTTVDQNSQQQHHTGVSEEV